ncbi:MAG TPA: hypothetical protein VGL61_10490 [Kofleriaceae bacterium]|jgi:hypothetical protein
MRLPRFFGFVDLGILTVMAVAVVLPPREMYASNVVKGGDDMQFKLALAEARTIARPEDGRAAESFVRLLDDADQKDWAIDAGVAASEHAKGSPTRWRTLFATASAYVDRLDVVPGLDYANRALAACDTESGACPSWEQIRMQLYQQSLDAGVKSGIDPRRDPRGFRKASESVIREIRLGPAHDKERGSAAPTPSHGSASGQ